MQLSAPETGGAVRPYIKLNDIGDSVVIAIGHVDKKIEVRDYDTDRPKRWDDGNPVYQTRIAGVVISSNGNAIGRMSGEDVPLEAGAEVAIFVSGGKNGNQGIFKDAERSVGGIQLGDIMQYKFDRTEAASNPRWNDRKIMTSAIRRATPEELQANKAECERIYHGFESGATISTPDSAQAVADAFGAGAVINEAPF